MEGIWTGGLSGLISLTTNLAWFYQQLGDLNTKFDLIELPTLTGFMVCWFGAGAQLNYEIHAVEELFQENEDATVKELQLYQAQCVSGHSCGVMLFKTATISRTFVFSVRC